MKKWGRLKKRSDFLRVQREGKKWVSKSLILQAAPGTEGTSRFGLTVTKKIDKRAVIRNRIRRRLRALAYDVLTEKALHGTDYVLIGRQDTLDKSYDEMCKELAWCLKRLECLKPFPTSCKKREAGHVSQ
ncbi:MAG: ribonuclease P protein component [Alphaproteobacteria bacterium]|nr:ribonuclease P protein component [Alphaproteobacteria bacterium]